MPVRWHELEIARPPAAFEDIRESKEGELLNESIKTLPKCLRYRVFTTHFVNGNNLGQLDASPLKSAQQSAAADSSGASRRSGTKSGAKSLMVFAKSFVVEWKRSWGKTREGRLGLTATR